MPIVCGVKFKGSCKAYYFSPGDVEDLKANDYVVVETSRGKEMGLVTMGLREIDEKKVVGQLKPILRRATPLDLLDAQGFQRQEEEALATCREHVERSGLPMKVVSAEYSFDGSRLTFYFASEDRVDFRDLVRELAHIFKTRIELRQIGVRDEAKILGGLGRCGRMLCCATWLNEFYPVSIRMAKAQDLPLSPEEISGQCGRLLCCLGYENDYYQEVRGRFPKVGKLLQTPLGMGKVIKVSVLRETVTVLFEDGSTADFTADQASGAAPMEPPKDDTIEDEDDYVPAPNLTPQWERTSLSLGQAAERTDRAAEPQVEEAPDEPSAEEGASETRAPSKSRSRRRRRKKPSDGGSNAPALGQPPRAEANAAGSEVRQGQDRPAARKRRRRKSASTGGSGMRPTSDAVQSHEPAAQPEGPARRRPSRQRRRGPRPQDPKPPAE
jgi:cell fate regulator YaaT (PSP1 superfamily)